MRNVILLLFILSPLITLACKKAPWDTWNLSREAFTKLNANYFDGFVKKIEETGQDKANVYFRITNSSIKNLKSYTIKGIRLSRSEARIVHLDKSCSLEFNFKIGKKYRIHLGKQNPYMYEELKE